MNELIEMIVKTAKMLDAEGYAAGGSTKDLIVETVDYLEDEDMLEISDVTNEIFDAVKTQLIEG